MEMRRVLISPSFSNIFHHRSIKREKGRSVYLNTVVYKHVVYYFLLAVFVVFHARAINVEDM